MRRKFGMSKEEGEGKESSPMSWGALRRNGGIHRKGRKGSTREVVAAMDKDKAKKKQPKGGEVTEIDGFLTQEEER